MRASNHESTRRKRPYGYHIGVGGYFINYKSNHLNRRSSRQIQYIKCEIPRQDDIRSALIENENNILHSRGLSLPASLERESSEQVYQYCEFFRG